MNSILTPDVTLLVIDDEPTNIAVLGELLEDRYRIRVANSGDKALALLAQDQSLPDLILLDVRMPGLSGYEVCERLKANPRTADIPIIFVTARDAPSDEEKGLKLGAVDYITKPFIPGIVRARVQTQINLKQKTDVIEKLNRNLSERVRQEVEKNREQERLLMHQSRFVQMGEMLSMIAHQWRQPLNSVSLAAINLTTASELGVLNAETVRLQASFIQELTRRMSETIDDFTDFFKPDRHAETFYLQEVFERVRTIANAQLKAHSIDLQVDLTPEVQEHPLLGRKNELAHVFLNLVTNARDAFEEKAIRQGLITIRAYLQTTRLIIQVSDNAGGIAPEALDRLFDPYFTTKPQGKGTGIGLYMCRTIIERNYQGDITVKNQPEGATFTLRLPLHTP